MINKALSIQTITDQKQDSIFSERNLSQYLTQERISLLLRLSLALVFFWFGMLKIVNASPVVALLQNSFALFAASPFLELLGIGEVLIAVGLALDRFSRYAAGLLCIC
jgi:uncharacterized membrane protein YphA (DoxX/SURF4 family)